MGGGEAGLPWELEKPDQMSESSLWAWVVGTGLEATQVCRQASLKARGPKTRAR